MSHMFVPGPVDVAPEVLAAQTKPMLPHRSKDFEAIFQRSEAKAKDLSIPKPAFFRLPVQAQVCRKPAFAILRKKPFFLVSMAHLPNVGTMWLLQMANRLINWKWKWAKPSLPIMLRDALKKKHYEAVTIVHNETSTGVENPG